MTKAKHRRVGTQRGAPREGDPGPAVRLRPPDSRTPAYVGERRRRRQCPLAARADEADAGVLDLLDEALDDLPGWQA